ncbi:hypothetical protein POX_a01581 [Penicillium oxalicum]|uniref:hypothetical protein n=1 Tax=Penicillium oxalicum TaxID=69781 RepID=UPI0020B70BBF|nr:hypothetical protein POX_a01581 [Penicillium oxalicum]KAI2794980.1 hypothetical protein POX_a01581 [Penicillium oxalicum]
MHLGNSAVEGATSYRPGTKREAVSQSIVPVSAGKFLRVLPWSPSVDRANGDDLDGTRASMPAEATTYSTLIRDGRRQDIGSGIYNSPRYSPLGLDSPVNPGEVSNPERITIGELGRGKEIRIYGVIHLQDVSY